MQKLSLCTVALCLGFASITHADPVVTKYKMKGNSASGGLFTPDDPCFTGLLSVAASEEMTKDATGTTSSKTLLISFTGFDNCQSLSLQSFVSVPLTVAIANQSTVTLPFDVVVDYENIDTGATFQKRLVGSATITATDDFEKSKRTQITENEGTRQVVRTKGTTRESTITATATLDGATLTFVPSTGEIGNVKNGSVEITRY
jgi:hypothetical protein